MDFSHNISPNLLSFQTRLTQWQRVCRPVQFDSVWFFHQPCNITTKVQLMKKHLTSTYFHQQFEHIFIFWNPVVCRFPYFISAKIWKKKIPYQYFPTQSFNTELGKSKQTTFTMWPHHGMSGISVSLNACPSVHNILPFFSPPHPPFLHKQILKLSHLNHKVINLLNITSIGQIWNDSKF